MSEEEEEKQEVERRQVGNYITKSFPAEDIVKERQEYKFLNLSKNKKEEKKED